MTIIIHVLFCRLFSFFLGAVILLIALTDNPFRGEVSISPEAFETVCVPKVFLILGTFMLGIFSGWGLIAILKRAF